MIGSDVDFSRGRNMAHYEEFVHGFDWPWSGTKITRPGGTLMILFVAPASKSLLVSSREQPEKASNNEAGEGEEVEGSEGRRVPLVVGSQATEAGGPGEASLHYSAARQHDEATFSFCMFDYVQLETAIPKKRPSHPHLMCSISPKTELRRGKAPRAP